MKIGISSIVALGVAVLGLVAIGAAVWLGAFDHGKAQQQAPRQQVEAPPTGVLIRIDEVLARDYQHGRASACVVAGQVINNSKYRVDNIGFDIAGIRVQTQSVRANDRTAKIELARLDPAQDGAPAHNCADLARNIVAAASVTPRLDCDMAPNVPEGDCQALTAIAIGITADAARKLREIDAAELSLEQQAQTLQKLPISQALRALLSGRSDDILVDFLIRTDAAHWFSNRYDEGSAHVTSKQADPVSGDTILHADFDYTGTAKGWVNVHLHKDLTIAPCLEFEDTDKQCNTLRHPDSMNEPPPPVVQVPVPVTPIPDPALVPAPPADATPDQTQNDAPGR